ncbi:MAG: SpoIID/LytB domain-containing protein [Lachnospiraceae bacterium]|nr:SpoIID/LytB domain-containing protein [Lachnospiraceae bacterium]
MNSEPRTRIFQAIFVLVLLGMGLMVWAFLGNGGKETGISRALAARQTALILAGQEEIASSEERFAPEDQGNWYVPYAEYLYQREIWDIERLPADRKTMGSALTYEDLSSMAEKLELSAELETAVDGKTGRDAVGEEDWQAFFEIFLGKYDTERQVAEQELLLIGTPNQLSEAGAWEVYTDKGVFSFEGLSLDKLVDQRVKARTKGKELLMLLETVSDEITYENVWVESYEEGSLRAYLYGVWRNFSVGTEGEQCGQNLADLTIRQGKVAVVSLKKERIHGKLLALGEQEAEIEGYGKVPLAEQFQVIQRQGGFQVLPKETLTVGYDQAEYVVGGGKICAAFLGEHVETANIRVLLTDAAIGSLYHEKAVFTSDRAYSLFYGKDESERHEAGEVVEISKEDARLSEGRIRIVPDEGGKVGFTSFSRKQGSPWYEGTAEVALTESGLVIVNEVDVETYLCYVVPSEMPESYGLEALKAQAVCARSYAYRQIAGGAYSTYGAHVDDTTNFQVYNNTETDDLTRQAVKETEGQVLLYGGNLVTTYYYATSSGYGNDMSVWGGSGIEAPYLRRLYMSEGEAPDLSSETAFREYLGKTDSGNLEYGTPWYRWETTVTLERLTERMNSFLAGYAKTHGELVLFQAQDGSFQEASGQTTIGAVRSITVQKRSVSGMAEQILVEGTEGTVQILRPGPIRAFLGDTDYVYTRQDGTTSDGRSILPSASVWLEEQKDGETLTGYIFHGGGYGHGVGMSQTGASTLASRGKGYVEILQYFYPGTEIGNQEISSPQ